jgi:murein DD-endopeptidase MepM/ murein hydrolase activator NlpD
VRPLRDPDPRPRRRAAVVATACASAAVTLTVLAALGHLRASAPAPAAPPTQDPGGAAVAVVPSVAPAAAPRPLRMSVLTVRLARNQTLSQALAALKLAPAQAKGILEALKDKFPFHRARPGDQLRVERADGELKRFTYRQSAADEWLVTPADGGALRGAKRAVALTTEVARVDVEIRGSVWESLQRVGEDPALVVAAADVLAWDVDFYQDVRSGDRLKLLVEKTYADGKLLRYGDVLAAEYTGEVTGKKRLFRYADPSGRASYFDDAGNGARRGFLKSPLQYAHVTSKFGGRVHPILGYQKKHQGVDYGAPTGTAVWAVGEGTVLQAGWNGGCGRSVTLRHRNGFDTIYCHLSSVAVHAGARVGQKQLVGAVGQTGLATGPHLHFAVKRGGSYVNPLSLKVPPEAPVAPEHRADFQEKVAPLRAKLDAAPVA